MSKKAACACKKHEECEECPEWIFTFADLVMLMMGFFVILWVLKPSADPKTNPDQAVIRIRARNGPNGKGKNDREIKGAVGTDPDVTTIRPGQQATVGGKLLF